MAGPQGVTQNQAMSDFNDEHAEGSPEGNLRLVCSLFVDQNLNRWAACDGHDAPSGARA
jgi:hypothetical protein